MSLQVLAYNMKRMIQIFGAVRCWWPSGPEARQFDLPRGSKPKTQA